MTVDADWWRHAVVYQIYPRSFADSDADGVGDLRGIVSRVPYLATLGIDAVWLSPFYPSALADGGYDVDDPRDVDPRLGTLADVDLLVAALREHGLRLIVDIVPNHSSDRHRWFREALASAPGSTARARYHFRDGRGPGGAEPPSDWRSGFGGSMWTPVGDGQWYLHIHTPQQPDLNWAHPEVRADHLETLRFWADRGVAGFRVDVAHLLAKDLPAELPDESALAQAPAGRHPFEDRDELDEIYAGWRALFDSYDPPLTAVAEAWVPPDRRARYARSSSLGQAFEFDLLRANWDPAEFRTVIEENLRLAAEAGSSSTWVLSNHDVVRHATRYGLPEGTVAAPQTGREWVLSDGRDPELDEARGLRRARAATLLLLALPGSAYLYQGEELGLGEVAGIPADRRQDPLWVRGDGAEPGRDGCRVPLPWTSSGPSFGFGAGGAGLPQPEWFGSVSVATQEADPASTLWLYRRALHARRLLDPDASLSWQTGDDGVLRFARGVMLCTTTFADPAPPPAGRLVLASEDWTPGSPVPPDTTVWTVITPVDRR